MLGWELGQQEVGKIKLQAAVTNVRNIKLLCFGIFKGKYYILQVNTMSYVENFIVNNCTKRKKKDNKFHNK